MKHFTTKLCALVAGTLALATVASAQADPPAWSAAAAYKVGNIVTYGGINFQCLINETTNRPNPHVPGAWDINFIYSGNVTIPVGPGNACLTLTSAWNYIKYARLAVGTTITIVINNNYSENFGSSFSLNHPYGSQIHIVGYGNGQTASFTGATAGFTLDSGHALAELRGFNILSASGSSGNPGILVADKAVISSMSDMTIQGFAIGLKATSGEINNVSALSITNFATGAVSATGSGALINVTSAITVDGSTQTSPPSFGFDAEEGGMVKCPNCVANDCANDFNAINNGTIYCSGSSATSPTGQDNLACYSAQNHGIIFADSSNAQGAVFGFISSVDSFIDASKTQASNYGSTGYGYYAVQMARIYASGSRGGSMIADSSSTISQ